jgi:hypothetical protein
MQASRPPDASPEEMRMQADLSTARYAKVIEVSQRVRWQIERDVLRGRGFDFAKTHLPPRLSLADELDFMGAADRRLMSQVQGRTYAYMFGLVERYIVAKAIELSRGHAFGDQTALQALVGMIDEEIKHQELFRQLDAMLEAGMPAGYEKTADPDAVAEAVLGKHPWAVLALTLDIELFSQAHYRASIEPRDDLCPLWKDVFLFHWREESQHAILDEMEFRRADAQLTRVQRDAALDDLIALVGAVDGILQGQAQADARWFCAIAAQVYDAAQREAIAACVLKAYRWQYIVTGVMEPRFQAALFGCLDDAQKARVQQALAPLFYAVPNAAADALPMAA